MAVGLHQPFPGILLKAEQAVVILLADGIVFEEIVAAGALHGQPQKRAAKVCARLTYVFVWYSSSITSFGSDLVVAVEPVAMTCSSVASGSRSPTRLPGDELVIGHVLPVGMDHPPSTT